MNLRNKLRNLGAAQQNVRAEMAGHITNNWIKTENQKRLTEKGSNEDSEDPIGSLLNQLPSSQPVSSNEIQRKFTRSYMGDKSNQSNLVGDSKLSDSNDPNKDLLTAAYTARFGAAQSPADKTYEELEFKNSPVDDAAGRYTEQTSAEQTLPQAYGDFREPSSSGFQEFADKKIGLNTTKKDIIRSASDKYSANTNAILAGGIKKNGKLKRKARLAIEKNQTKQRSLRQVYDNLPKY